jgi:3-hydroxyisobutyrate dehydrogenase-like beta-hydroxyacid dehydrogenase
MSRQDREDPVARWVRRELRALDEPTTVRRSRGSPASQAELERQARALGFRLPDPPITAEDRKRADALLDVQLARDQAEAERLSAAMSRHRWPVDRSPRD